MDGVIRMEYGSRYESAFKDAVKSPEYWLEDVQISFLDAILKAMETKRVTRKELAERLGKSQAYVSRTLNAGALNFTVKTMVNLSLALGLKLSLELEDLSLTEAANWKSQPNAERIYEQGFNLPASTANDEESVRRAAEIVREVLLHAGS